jgi:phosphoglucosamine mutase
VRIRGGRPLDDDRVKATIEDATRRLGNYGRLVIRPSGTEPLIRVMAEGDDEGLVRRVVDDIADMIGKAAA